MSDIFISYHHEEREIAKLLANALQGRGWSVWWDVNNLSGGDRFREAIQQAIQQTRCLIVVWSSKSVKSSFVEDEVSEAIEDNKFIIPV